MLKNLNLLRAFLAILILAIPLYPKFPLYGVADTYVSIRLEDFLVAFTVIILFAYQLKHHFRFLKWDITKFFLSYFVAIIASTVTAILIFKTDPTSLLLINVLRRFEYISLFFVTASAIYNINDLKYPAIFSTLATIGVCLYGYGQKYLQFPVVSTMNEEFSKGQVLSLSTWTRINATFAGHYDLAVYLSVMLVIIGCLAVLLKKLYLKVPLLIIWLIAFQILTFTASRTSIFAMWGGLVLALLVIKKYLWIVPVTLIVVFSFFNSRDLNQRLLATLTIVKNDNQPTQTIPTPTIVTPSIPPVPVIAKISPIITIAPTPIIIHHGVESTYPEVDVDAGVSRSGEIRFNVEWPRALTALKKNPLVGTGLGSITLATDNDYLRSLGESGIIGFIALFIIPFWFIFKTLPFVFKKNQTSLEKYALILAAAVITMGANAIFIDVFEASKTAFLFWIMMGVYYKILEFIKQA